MRNLMTLAIVLFVGASLSGCNSQSCNDCCNDCGPCGWTGAADPTVLDFIGPGVDKSGAAAVDLGLEAGECRGDQVLRFRVSYSGGVVTVAAADEIADLDSSVISSMGETYKWTDRDLTMSKEGTFVNLMLTFSEPGKSVSVSCAKANQAIVCTPQ